MKPLTRPLSLVAGLVLVALLVLPVWPAHANIVTFDLQPVGTLYGAPAGQVPGDYIFSENLADIYVQDFFNGGVPYFNFGRIETPFLGFGSGHIMNLNNLSILIDFTAPGNTSFEFLDLGGIVNIQVNGAGPVIEAPDFPSLGTFTIAPGVTMSTTWTTVGGGITGVVTLTGPVEKLRVGGQEFWVDDLECDNGVGDDPGDCDFAVDYESLSVGTVYGAPVGQSPGDWCFNEDGIDVHVVEFDYGGGLLFHLMEVDPAFGPLGSGRVMEINNIGQLFNLGGLGIVTSQVTFEYIDYGGTENLQINGSPLMVGDLDTWSGLVLGGVHVQVAAVPYGAGIYGLVTLTGNVVELRVGGQEFWMDDLCVTEAVECDLIVDHESLSPGDLWGGPSGTPPGTVIFSEDGIPVTIGILDAGGTPTYNYCEVVPAIFGVGTGNVMLINNVTNTYEIHVTGVVTTEVSFVYLDQGGIENLQVNGAPLYVGELDLAPPNIAPGVICNVSTWMTGGGLAGLVTLTGQVDRLLVGGQEFFIDEVCVHTDDTSDVASATPTAGLTLEPNYPNPFNPSTNLRFTLGQADHVRLSIHDLAGRLVRILVDEQRVAGPHSVQWNGRSDAGLPVSAGIYFVRAASGKETAIQKIALIR